MKVIAVFTETGSTARLVSKHRPQPPIIAFSPRTETRRRLSLLWADPGRDWDPPPFEQPALSANGDDL